MMASVSQIARVVRLGVGLLAPEVGFHHAAAAHADLQPSVAQVVEHADLFDQAERMVQRQHVDARAEAQASRALGHRGQEHVLRRRQAVDGRRVVLGQVVGVEAGRVEALDLDQPLAIDLVQALPRHRLDVVEHAESHGHGGPSEPNDRLRVVRRGGRVSHGDAEHRRLGSAARVQRGRGLHGPEGRGARLRVVLVRRASVHPGATRRAASPARPTASSPRATRTSSIRSWRSPAPRA